MLVRFSGDTAYQKGSGDNLTATVIEFGWVTEEQVLLVAPSCAPQSLTASVLTLLVHLFSVFG